VEPATETECVLIYDGDCFRLEILSTKFKIRHEHSRSTKLHSRPPRKKAKITTTTATPSPAATPASHMQHGGMSMSGASSLAPSPPAPPRSASPLNVSPGLLGCVFLFIFVVVVVVVVVTATVCSF
jgi:hypothetical protein